MIVEFIKTDVGTLKPADDGAREQIAKLADGEFVLAQLRRPRNLGHHRKFFAMAKFAFQQWNPKEASIAGMPAKKSFDNFRKELVIQAGYYECVLGLDGHPRLEAESLAFDRMDQATFEEVYDSVLQVLLGGVLEGMDKDEAQRLADAVAGEGF